MNRSRGLAALSLLVTAALTLLGTPAEAAPAGAAIPGTAGEHTITVGLVDQGPGTLRYPPFFNNILAVREFRVSVLDRSRTRAGEAESAALGGTVAHAVQAERFGYGRFLVAEHHGVPGIAGAAPAVLLTAVAGATATIRIGSAGVMLPHHQPLVVAEQFATLSAFAPGRTDLGPATYLSHWRRESGLADLLPSLPDQVWVGVSAGSMVMTPRIGADFVEWPSAPDDRTLGIVDFSIFPHLNAFPENAMAHAERWATGIGGPAYAIDEQTAIQVVDGSVEVISEGHWTKFG